MDQARVRHLYGVVGDYTLRRAYDLCEACHCAPAPLDAPLGVGPGARSPALLRVIGRLGSAASVEEALDVAQETLGVSVPLETARRATESIGAVAEADQQADMAAARAGQPLAATASSETGVLAVAVAGVQVPYRLDYPRFVAWRGSSPSASARAWWRARARR